jgi:hypothetical protein
MCKAVRLAGELRETKWCVERETKDAGLSKRNRSSNQMHRQAPPLLSTIKLNNIYLHKSAAASKMFTSLSLSDQPMHPKSSSACFGLFTSAKGTPPFAIM